MTDRTNTLNAKGDLIALDTASTIALVEPDGTIRINQKQFGSVDDKFVTVLLSKEQLLQIAASLQA